MIALKLLNDADASVCRAIIDDDNFIGDRLLAQQCAKRARELLGMIEVR
jgi:hypothetical protein